MLGMLGWDGMCGDRWRFVVVVVGYGWMVGCAWAFRRISNFLVIRGYEFVWYAKFKRSPLKLMFGITLGG